MKSLNARLRRRELLALVGGAAGAAILGACAPAAQAPTPASAAQPATTTEPGAEPTQVVPATKEPVTVEMWAPHPLEDNIKISEFVAGTFAPQHPDINFVFNQVVGDWEEKFRTAAAGATLPDIFAVDGINVPAYASRGLCAEIDEMVVPKDVRDDYWPPALAEMRYHGKTYAVVLETNSQGVRVNVDLMEKAGVEPPETWEQLVDVGQKLTLDANGKHPNEAGFDENAMVQAAMETWCCLGEGAVWMITPWIWMNGGEVLEEDSRKVRLAEEPAIEAIQFLQDLVHKHRIWAKAGVMQAGPEGTFYGQLVAMSWTGAYDVANLTETNPPNFNWDIAAAPYPSKTGQRISGVGGWLFSAWSQGKQLAATMEFIRFMTTPEWHRQVTKYGYALSGRITIAKERLAEVPQLQVFVDAMATGRARPRSSQYPLISDALGQAFDATIFGGQPVGPALEEAAQKITDAVAQEVEE